LSVMTHSGHRPEGWAHRRRTRDHAASVNHAQRGDPAKLAKGIMRLVEAPNLPTRLSLGSDTVERIEAKHALYRVLKSMTLRRFPRGAESDSRRRTEEVRHVGSDTVTPGF
jgi:hypothetical protein